ncbi:HNH endonuclease [Lysobacter sp. Root604]|uniref:HNH endonuclease n=1 Tax=Lysobacter sp. Root604 TaxID=1736568 RepID=UPI0006FA51F0|nr:HNH endonuclease [Lysobacter sp. Root604]
MATEDRFKQSVIVTLAKRAANRCSNPDCKAITSGPTDDPAGSVNVGEAAHIYGANPGAARYDADMSSSARSDISNAIWLCGNCHKLVDDDPNRFPVGLLFEWQREHARTISDLVGKAGADVRERYEKRHLDELGRLSYLAERLILEKDGPWEYRLTAEVLRFEMAPVLRRWDALQRGLYMKPATRVAKVDFLSWLDDRMAEIRVMIRAFGELSNVEFARAWGAPGVPGIESDIISVCRLYREVCEACLAWEETVRFSTVDDVYIEVRDLLVGVAGGIIDEAAKVPDFMSKILADNRAEGQFLLSMKLSLPDGWSDKMNSALARARRSHS